MSVNKSPFKPVVCNYFSGKSNWLQFCVVSCYFIFFLLIFIAALCAVCSPFSSQPIVRRINFYVDCPHEENQKKTHTRRCPFAWCEWILVVLTVHEPNFIRVLNFYFHVEIWEVQAISLDLFGNDVHITIKRRTIYTMCIHSSNNTNTVKQSARFRT